VGLRDGYIGVMGIQYVAKLSRYLIVIPAAMVLLVFSQTSAGISQYVPADPHPFIAFTLLCRSSSAFSRRRARRARISG